MVYDENKEKAKLEVEARKEKEAAEAKIKIEEEKRHNLKVGEIKRKIEETKRNISRLRDKLRQKENDLNKNKLLKRQASEDAIRLETALKSEKGKTGEDQRKRLAERKKAELSDFESKAARTKEAAEEKKEEMERKAATLTEEVARKKTILTDIKSKEDQLKAQIERLNAQLKSLENQKSAEEEELKELSFKQSEAVRAARLTETYSANPDETAAQGVKKHIEKLEEEIGRDKAKNVAMAEKTQSALAAKEKEIKKIDYAIDQIEKEISGLTKEVNNLETTLHEEERELRAA